MPRFQSTPLMRGATCVEKIFISVKRFQSTPLMRGATDIWQSTTRMPDGFNPRPSCEGRRHVHRMVQVHAVVSIHAPHARGDPAVCVITIATLLFQSTPLMRGATAARADKQLMLDVSIHAPHARGDPEAGRKGGRPRKFQSTPLMRGATAPGCRSAPPAARFNPRPSCEGRRAIRLKSSRWLSFNPRPSCEGRRRSRCRRPAAPLFQSTPLMRGATDPEAWESTASLVSIHAPHARGDRYASAQAVARHGFQSTPLMRGATLCRTS